MRRILAAILVAVALVVVPGIAAATGNGVSGLLVRVQGDVVVGEAESADVVLVISGDADVRGRAAAVVVVGGTARITGGQVGHLVVVRGTAQLERGTVVEGDVWLASARLDQAPGATVEGTVHRGVLRFGWSWLVVSPLLSVGLAVLAVAAGLCAVALAGGRIRYAGSRLTQDLVGSLLWAVVLFAVVPALAMLAFFTVVGLPLAMVALAVVLPAVLLAGFAVAALRLGTWLLRSGPSLRPYGAAALGAVLLLAVGLIPVAGPIMVVLAAGLGAGALARTFGTEPEEPEPEEPEPEEPEPAAESRAETDSVPGPAVGAEGGPGPSGEVSGGESSPTGDASG